MSSIDNRVVKMSFDNAQFEAGARQTLATLQALSKGLKLEGATKGFDELSSAAARASNMGGLGNAVQAIADKFKALSVIGITALTNIANKAVDAGLALAHSITFQPIMDGFREYETNLNSIQTILANTGLEGQAGLNKVNAALQELNAYSDQTIYNFSEMARNIGTFTAAGVKLDVATAAIKGISNLAAISGSNAQQASAAMYQLSQAISAGRVSLEDWNSVVNSGMGGKVFQDALIETARVHGVAIDQMIKDEGSFRLTLQKGWLTSNILTETLQKFTGDLTASQLKAMGYNDQQIAGIIKMGQTAQDAATKVKTFSQLISTLQEAVGSGWAQTWQILFGDFEEARTLFTNVSEVLGGFVHASADARNEVLGDWKEMGGRTVLIEAISNAFTALVSVVRPIGQAFRDIFPATTAKQLYDFVVLLRNFTAGLELSSKTAENLRRTFAGVFAIFGIVFDVVKEAVKTLFSLFGLLSGGGESFLEITAKIGDFLVAVRNAIHNGTALSNIFKAIGAVLAVPIKLIALLAKGIGKLFEKFKGNEAAESVGKFFDKFDPVAKLAQEIISAWGKVPGLMEKVAAVFLPLAKNIGGFFGKLGTAIKESFSDLDFSRILDVINKGLFGALLLALTNFVRKLKSGGDVTEGLIDKLTEPLDELTNTLKTMQNTLRAATLLEIAAAVGILTLSVIGLSKVDGPGLARALTGLAVMFGQLIGTMILFEHFGTAGAGKMILVGAALILLATAVDILTIAVKSLSTLSWEDLAKGLIGLTVILGALVGVVVLMPNDAKLLSTSIAMIALATAVRILAEAVQEIAMLSWDDLARGLIGVGVVLAALTLFTKFAAADKAGILQGAGILLLAVGVKILADAVTDFAKLSWGEIGKGLVALAGGLTLMAAALILIPPSSLLSAAAILVVAASLGMVADALKKMGSFSWGEIGKSLTLLAGALVIIAVAMIAMTEALPGAAALIIVAVSLGILADALKKMGEFDWGEIGKSLTLLFGALLIISLAMIAMVAALPGAAALLIVAASLAILAPILKMFGEMSLTEIGKSLLELAGVFAVLGVAGLVLAPIVPILVALGLAITLIGVGILAAGAGVLLFSAGLTALAISGTAAAIALVAIVTGLAGTLPLIAHQFGVALIEFAKVIGQSGPQITQAFVALLSSLIDAAVKLAPKIVDAIFTILSKIQDTMIKYLPKMTDTGLKLLVGFLNGIANNIGDVVTAATNVIVKFMDGISQNLPRITDAGVRMIIAFVNGLANSIRDHQDEMNEAGRNLGSAIISGMLSGLSGGAGKITSMARNLASSALNEAKDVLGIHSPSRAFMQVGEFSGEGLVIGLKNMIDPVSKASSLLGKNALDSVKSSLSDISDIVTANIDTNPTIRPVLDLTDVNKNAGKLDKLMAATRKMDISAATISAQTASVGFKSNQNSDGSTTPSTETPSTVTYNQYNNSPKALSEAEIYRQTKNQLSKKGGSL